MLIVHQERSLGTSLCTTVFVLAVSSNTSGGESVELRIESTVLLSDSMDTFSSANLSSRLCMSCSGSYEWTVLEIQYNSHLTREPTGHVSHRTDAEREEEGAEEGEAGHDGAADDQHDDRDD